MINQVGIENVLNQLLQNLKTDLDYQKKMLKQYAYLNLREPYYESYEEIIRIQKIFEKVAQITKKDFDKKTQYLSLLRSPCSTFISNEKDFKGGSFEHPPKNFTFEFCPFRSVKQVSSTKPTLLGLWYSWVEESTATKIRSSSAHLQKTKGPLMIYSGGDECWNGPKRVVYVAFECGIDNSIQSVRENGKCLYEIIVISSSACEENQVTISLQMIDVYKNKIQHEEL